MWKVFKKRKFFPTPYDLALEDIEEAKEELRTAEQNFNLASPEYFEIANMELTVAEMRLKICRQKAIMLMPKVG